jgi:hypothetical protein
MLHDHGEVFESQSKTTIRITSDTKDNPARRNSTVCWKCRGTRAEKKLTMRRLAPWGPSTLPTTQARAVV